MALRQVAKAKGEMFKRLVSVLDHNFEFPQYSFLHEEVTTPKEIEHVAEARIVAAWGLGLGPVSNMSRVAEHAGAVLVGIDGLSDEIDAISFSSSTPGYHIKF